jgi:SAM-dependent methyltransferase
MRRPDASGNPPHGGRHSGTLGERYTQHNRMRGRGFVYGAEARVSALGAMIDPPIEGWIVDLGCRDGSLAAALQLPSTRTLGVDIDVEALQFARERGSLFPCCGNLWGPLPLRSRSVRLVVAGEVIEHVPFPDDLLSEIRRILDVGGKVVGSVPNAFSLKNRLKFLGGRWFDDDPTHLRYFSVRALHDLLSRFLVDVRIRPCVGRFSSLWPRMMSTDLVWSAKRS